MKANFNKKKRVYLNVIEVLEILNEIKGFMVII